MFSLSNYSFNPHAVPPLVTALSVLFLGLIIVFRERGSRVSLLYLIYTLSVFTWLFSASLLWLMPPERIALVWMKVANSGVTLIPAALYHFTVVVLGTEQQNRKRVTAAWVISSLFLLLNVLTNVLFTSFYRYRWGMFLRYRWPAVLFLVYFFVMTVNVLRLYWLEYRTSDRQTTKQRRSKALLTAFSIGYLASLDFLPAFGIPYYPLSPLAMSTMIILITRAIWRYRLVDITPAFAAREIIDTMNDALIVLDPDRIVRVVNQAACTLLRRREQDVIGKRPGVGMAICTEFAEQLESIILSGPVRNREVDYHPEGSAHRVLSLSTSVMRNETGEPLATVVLARDISDRKSSELALLMSEERLSRAQRMAQVGNWEWDLATGHLWWSEEVYRIYGVNRACFAPSFDALEKAMHPADLAAFKEAVRASIEGRKPFELDYRLIRPDGTVRTVHTIGEVSYDPSGKPVSHSGTVQDITEQKHSEEERELLIAQLQEVNEKLQSIDKMKTDFISMVSHELRTPLTTIKAFVELLIMKRGMPEQQKVKLMKTINAETDRLARLITDLLDLARIEAGSMRWQTDEVSIEEVIRAVIASMELLFANKALHLTTSFDTSLPRISGDRDRLVQVVTNILSNAVKFTPAGGSIHIAVTPQPGSEQIIVEISDTGVGIPETDLELIFEKFHRSRHKETAGIEGTGLGLAISRQIVEHYGGRIWARSRRGQGSVFTFTLPVKSQ